MNYRFALVALALVVTASASNCLAQDKERDPEHMAAVFELFDAMHLEKTLGESTDKMLDLQIKQNPAIAPFGKIMKKFFDKHLSWDKLKDEMAEIYADEFTTEELKELTEFYKTPLGKKVALRMPELMNKGAQLGMRRVQQNMPELQQMIIEEQQRLQNPQ